MGTPVSGMRGQVESPGQYDTQPGATVAPRRGELLRGWGPGVSFAATEILQIPSRCRRTSTGFLLVEDRGVRQRLDFGLVAFFDTSRSSSSVIGQSSYGGNESGMPENLARDITQGFRRRPPAGVFLVRGQAQCQPHHLTGILTCTDRAAAAHYAAKVPNLTLQDWEARLRRLP